MSTDVQAQLRHTLRTRAEDITEIPEWLLTPSGLHTQHPKGHRPDGRRRILAAVAAAAVVLTVAGLAGFEDLSGGTHHPAGPPTGHPTSTAATKGPSPAPVTGGLHALTCHVPLPAAWQSRIASSDSAAGTVLAITPSGSTADLVSTRLTQRLVLDSATGRRTLYQVREDTSVAAPRIGSAAASDTWVVFTLIFGTGGGQGAVQIDAVRTTGGPVHVLRATTATDPTIVLGPALYRGAVYWAQIDAGAGRSTGPMVRYQLASAQRSVVARGQLSAPVVEGGGLYWDDGAHLVAYQPGTLPPGYTPEPWKLWGGLAQQGGTYAWTDSSTTSALMWRSGMPRALVAAHRAAGARAYAVAGPYLIWQGGVLDTRTGAGTRLPSTVSAAYPHGQRITLQTAGGAFTLDLASLPGLHC